MTFCGCREKLEESWRWWWRHGWTLRTSSGRWSVFHRRCHGVEQGFIHILYITNLWCGPFTFRVFLSPVSGSAAGMKTPLSLAQGNIWSSPSELTVTQVFSRKQTRVSLVALWDESWCQVLWLINIPARKGKVGIPQNCFMPIIVCYSLFPIYQLSVHKTVSMVAFIPYK